MKNTKSKRQSSTGIYPPIEACLATSTSTNTNQVKISVAFDESDWYRRFGVLELDDMKQDLYYEIKVRRVNGDYKHNMTRWIRIPDPVYPGDNVEIGAETIFESRQETLVKFFRYLRLKDPANNNLASSKGGIVFEISLYPEIKVLAFSAAICSPEDYFNRQVGRALASDRGRDFKYIIHDYNPELGAMHNIYMALSQSMSLGGRPWLFNEAVAIKLGKSSEMKKMLSFFRESTLFYDE